MAEILHEIVAADVSFHTLFDRVLDSGDRSVIDEKLGNLPRVVLSRSLERLTADARLLPKHEVKIATVKMGISAFLAVELVDVEGRKGHKSPKPRGFLNAASLV